MTINVGVHPIYTRSPLPSHLKLSSVVTFCAFAVSIPFPSDATIHLGFFFPVHTVLFFYNCVVLLSSFSTRVVRTKLKITLVEYLESCVSS